MSSSHEYDVLIVGAGLSGIGAAYHVQDKCPDKSYAILEGRAALGGTWDLFKYPGLRSDSDMYTLGFPFHPWKDPRAIADGAAILDYIQDTARTFGIDQHIKYHHKVVAADWSSEQKRWVLRIDHQASGVKFELSCRFLLMCSGYYNYEAGHFPDFPGAANFRGTIMHPQHWDLNFDYTDRRVVIIGSGATAITLVPEIAKRARQVTMLQRSPSYIMNLPREDRLANRLKRWLPAKLAHHLIRWKNILLGMTFYQISQRRPNRIKRLLQGHIRQQLGDQYEERHFDPSYKPWDQRLCMVPDNDLFKAIRSGRAAVVTDTIDQFEARGIRLQSGELLEADLIVSATGLQVQLLGGMQLSIDAKPIRPADTHAFRGVLFSDIPNLAISIGSTNASWTLKCDLNSRYALKVLQHMDRHGYHQVTPRFDADRYTSKPLLDLSSGYIQRAKDLLPKAGDKAPWKVNQNYLADLLTLKYGKVTDPALEYR